MKVRDLITAHPGGWNDIIAMLLARHKDVEVRVSDSTWVLDHVMIKKKGMTLSSSTKVLTRGGQIDTLFPLGKLLAMDADFPVSSSGALASMMHRMLMDMGYPVPGDKEWTSPAMNWEQKERWNYSSVTSRDRKAMQNAERED